MPFLKPIQEIYYYIFLKKKQNLLTLNFERILIPGSKPFEVVLQHTQS